MYHIIINYINWQTLLTVTDTDSCPLSLCVYIYIPSSSTLNNYSIY